MSALVLHPGAVPLSAWREIYFGRDAALDPACRPAVERSAAVVDAIVAAGARPSTGSTPVSAS